MGNQTKSKGMKPKPGLMCRIVFCFHLVSHLTYIHC